MKKNVLAHLKAVSDTNNAEVYLSSDFVSNIVITGNNMITIPYLFCSLPHPCLTFHRHWEEGSASVVETRFRGKSAIFSSSSSSSSSSADSIGSAFTCTMAYAEGTLTTGDRWLWLLDVDNEMLLLLSGVACRASMRWGWICLRSAANISTGSSLLLPLLPDSRTDIHHHCKYVTYTTCSFIRRYFLGKQNNSWNQWFLLEDKNDTSVHLSYIGGECSTYGGEEYTGF